LGKTCKPVIVVHGGAGTWHPVPSQPALKSVKEAAEEAVALVNKRITGTYNAMGLVALNVHGRIGAAHNSPNLCWAYMTADHKEPVAFLKASF
jgi:isoaspartyl peptidase/L-asparaginase-like protein (Ntn-hydrolase superfamily)